MMKMKTKTLFYMALTAVMTTLAACSQDDELMDAAPKPAAIEFEITDGGYGGDEATRAKEEGFRTKFEAGDNCGLYIVRGGSLVAKNVILTAEAGDNGEITWKAADGAISGAAEGDKYFLCYPPVVEAEDKVNPSATDSDDTFFARIISGWNTLPNQNDYAYYRYSDLKTAAGEVKNEDGKLKVSFSLNHKMALAVIEVPRTVYKFTNDNVKIPPYVPTSVDFNDGDIKPLRMADGTYRCIVKPDATENIASIKGKVSAGKTFTITPSEMPAGKYTRFVVKGGTINMIEHKLQVGDCLMTDGTLKPRSDINDDNKDDVVAIVFSVGHNQYDNSDYSSTGLGLKKCHGYAVAKEDATSSKCKWGKYNVELKLYPLDGEGKKINNNTYYYMDWSGYSYTQTIIDKVGGKGNLSAEEKGYPATYYAVVTYPETTPAPATTSGWFLPAVGQMWEVADKRSILFDSTVGTSLVNWYWSSSEYYNYAECNAMIVTHDGGVGSYGKDDTRNNYIVRAILAF